MKRRANGLQIGIVGAGKIGTTIATLLESCDFCRSVLVGDSRRDIDLTGLKKSKGVLLDVKGATAVARFVNECDAVVSAAPFFLNGRIARACARAGVSYFDLTEDVVTTSLIRDLSEGSDATFMPQCGLAPGAINIIGGSLTTSLKKVRQCELRVGALPLHASNQMKYYLSWSTAGLINEYCQLGEALHGCRRMPTLPLDGLERITIDGTEYEAFNTSGGVATMCETFEGKVSDLSYKTLRYPGHRDLMKFLLQDLNLGTKQELLTQIFDQEVALTDSDVVVFYVSVVGQDAGGLVQRSFVKKMRGDTVAGRRLNAIQMTTAAGVVGVLEIFANGNLTRGFVKQESISMSDFMDTQWGERVYGA